MSAATKQQQLQPVELGTKNFERLGRLFRAADYYLTRYRECPNYPDNQAAKASLWSEYQATVRELREALDA